MFYNIFNQSDYPTDLWPKVWIVETIIAASIRSSGESISKIDHVDDLLRFLSIQKLPENLVKSNYFDIVLFKKILKDEISSIYDYIHTAHFIEEVGSIESLKPNSDKIRCCCNRSEGFKEFLVSNTKIFKPKFNEVLYEYNLY